MPVIERRIVLDVPVELAVRYLRDPSHLTEFHPNIIEVSNVERHPQRATKFAWVYKMMDARIFGEAELNETKHSQQLNLRFWGGMQGSIEWQFQPLDKDLRLEAKFDYVTPGPLLKKHSEDAIFCQNEAAVEQMLTNLKALLNAQSARNPNRV